MSRSPSQKQADQYTADNLACAKIYLAAPDKYPGVMQTWAQMIVDAHEAANRWELTA